MSDFIENHCKRGDDLKCTLASFYEAFVSLSEIRKFKKNTVSRRLKDAGYEVRPGTGNMMFVYGLLLDIQNDNSTLFM